MDRRQSGVRGLMLLSGGLVLACGPTAWAADARLGALGLVQSPLQGHAAPLGSAGTSGHARSPGTEGEDVDPPVGAAPQVEVRVGDHGKFERIAFEWPAPIEYDVVRHAERVTVEFSRAGRIDVSGIADRLRRVVDAWAEDVGATTRVTLQVSPNARVRSLDLRDGRVAIDLFGGTAAPSLASPAPDPEHDTIQELRRALEQRDAVIEDLLARFEQLTARFEQLERTVALSSGDLDRVTAGRAEPMPWVGEAPRPQAHSPSPAADAGELSGAARSAPATPEQQTAATNQAPGSESTGAPASQDTAQGEVPAPGQVEVDEEAAERALEVTLVQQGALLLPFGSAQFTPSFSYTRQTGDFPVVLGPPGNQVIAEQEVRRNEFDFSASLFVGLPFDSQLELGLPYNLAEQKIVDSVGGRAARQSSETGHGLGDFSVGLAKAVLRERNWWPDVILRVNWDTGTGESEDNDVPLDGGFQELTGSISLTKRQDPLAFVGGAAYQTTFEHHDIDPGDTLAFSIGTFLAASPDTSLYAVLNQSFIDEFKVDGQNIDGSDQVQSILTFGASAILGRNMLVDAAVGVGLTDDSPDYSVSISLPIRFSTPGF